MPWMIDSFDDAVYDRSDLACLTGLVGMLYSFAPGMVYLSPAPLYHAAPLRYSMAVQKFGGTVIVMEKFDAERYLQLVEQYKVTHSQVVPTMFVKMLKLPDDVRTRHDVSSLKAVIHAAAPCPIAAVGVIVSPLCTTATTLPHVPLL
jgi:acyl-CoA synthetase (AMP-forming)/AMP-acid ligase II